MAIKFAPAGSQIRAGCPWMVFLQANQGPKHKKNVSFDFHHHHPEGSFNTNGAAKRYLCSMGRKENFQLFPATRGYEINAESHETDHNNRLPINEGRRSFWPMAKLERG
ncbi:MAG: hypothetical protein IIC64_06985 [SAR324 cluster bacterium]|nr:hypothetical protein [SAR324 cluster bacterium]